MLGGRDVVIVGMGRVGRIVVEQLQRDRSISVVDRRAERLEMVPDRLGRVNIHKVQGDATSRLVMDQTRMDARSVLIAVTGDDMVNREVARLAREHYGVEEIVTLVDDLDGMDHAGLSPADALQRYRATAALVLNRVTAGQTRGVALGLGQGELLQVRVMPAVPQPAHRSRRCIPTSGSSQRSTATRSCWFHTETRCSPRATASCSWGSQRSSRAWAPSSAVANPCSRRSTGPAWVCWVVRPQAKARWVGAHARR